VGRNCEDHERLAPIWEKLQKTPLVRVNVHINGYAGGGRQFRAREEIEEIRQQMRLEQEGG
jgi:hypothetical protein